VNVDEREIDTLVERVQAFDPIKRLHDTGRVIVRKGIAYQLVDGG
jgi:hypothetical protein